MERNILFVDVAPRRKRGFHFGFFVLPRGIRSYTCPVWIDSLQQAELFAIFQVKLAGYLKWSRVLVGSDSFVARQQVTSLRCASGLRVQNRLLRRLFWWQQWSAMGLAYFYVHTELNPADPPSRMGRFHSASACRDSAIGRYERWKGLDRPFPYFTAVPPFPLGGGGLTYVCVYF